MNDLAAALAQSRMPESGGMGQMPSMPPMPEPQPGGVAAGPAQGDVFRQAINLAASELGPNAPQEAIQQLAVQILQAAGVAPPQPQGMPPQGMPPQMGMPQGGPAPQGAPMRGPQGPMARPPMPGGMPPRGM